MPPASGAAAIVGAQKPGDNIQNGLSGVRWISGARMMRAALIHMATGLGLVVTGIAATAASYALANLDGGGAVFLVAFGVMAAGAWRFLMGLLELILSLFQLARGTVSASSVGPQTASIGPLAGGGLAAVGAPLTTDPLGAAAPTVVGVLLIAQAVVRLGLIAKVMMQDPIGLLVRRAFDDAVEFLVSPLFVPGALAIAGLVAGELVLRRTRSAPVFGVAFCVVSLVYLLMEHGSRLVVLSNMVVNAFCLLVFFFSSYYSARFQRP